MGTEKDNWPNRLRAAIYIRIATGHDEAAALEAQRKQLHSFAKEKNYTVVAEVAEAASGFSPDRPGIQELSALAHRGEIDVVLTMDTSRLFRNPGRLLQFEDKMAQQHVRLDTLVGDHLADYRKIARALRRRQNCR